MKVEMYEDMPIPKFVRNYTNMVSTRREDVKVRKRDAKVSILFCVRVLSRLNVRKNVKKAFISKV